MKYPPVKLNTKGFNKYQRGELWFTTEDLEMVEKLRESLREGDLVSIYSKDGHFLGQGYINLSAYYALKVLTTEATPINEVFFQRAFDRALNFRRKIYPHEKTFRLIFAEGDFLPGLIVDIFERVAVIQIHTRGMENLRELIIRALLKTYPLESLIFKNDFDKRKEENLPMYVEFHLKDPGELIQVTLDEIKFLVPLKKGQKTGLFLDQRENWRYVSKITSDLTVVDAFSYLGSFSHYSLKGGAKRSFLMERSAYAIDLALEIAKLNGWDDKVIPVEGDVLKLLKSPPVDGDLLVIDPPAFIKSRRDIEKGIRRYRELFYYAISFFRNKRGYLSLFSCSHFLSLADMKNLIIEILKKEKISSRLFHTFCQAPDHPINPSVKETEYLKGLAVEINSLRDFC
ncbi:MAG: class I SAM-dependent rRNA methyltransferase [Caldimicrobium sp.]|nr:class I SAM-dependent rRNA methyltransferase [Caldimicrobium sp.]MCX7612941.1 class I SAM-dependent rRNA methyltransferase [Caldimicrobium sp.]MDW8182092.1 class I SAM-dependent rRNA methyltransferase [Caldimicrobium sp.]